VKALSISTRLKLGFTAITLAFLFLSSFTAWKLELVSRAAASMDTQTQLLHLAEKWQANVRQNSARALAAAYADGTAVLDFFKESVAAVTIDTNETQKAYLALVQDDAGRKAGAEVGEARKSWSAVRDEIIALKAAGDAAGAKALAQSKFVSVTDGYIRSTQVMVDDQMNDIHQTQLEIQEMCKQIYWIGGCYCSCVSGLPCLPAGACPEASPKA